VIRSSIYFPSHPPVYFGIWAAVSAYSSPRSSPRGSGEFRVNMAVDFGCLLVPSGGFLVNFGAFWRPGAPTLYILLTPMMAGVHTHMRVS